VSETHLNPNKQLANMNSFNILRYDRSFQQCKKSKGGGVALIVNSIINTTAYNLKCFDKICETSHVEITAGRIKSGHQKAIIVAALYRPPNYKMKQIKSDIDAIELILSELCDTNKHFYMLGDFNLREGWVYSMLEQICRKLNLRQIVQVPTRHNAILDLIITNKPDTCLNTQVINSHISDHHVIHTTLSIK